METKPNRFLQIGTLVFAVSMLATYMVYSQLQRTRYVTPSASSTTNHIKGPHPPAVPHKTDLPRRQLVVAPSSKVRAPLLEMPTPAPKPNAPPGLPISRSRTVAPGSKSAPVFDLRSQQQAPELPEFYSKMVAPGSKSGPVFDLRSPPQVQAPAPSQPRLVAPGSKSAPVFDVHQQQAVRAAQIVGTAPGALRTTNAPPTSHSLTH